MWTKVQIQQMLLHGCPDERMANVNTLLALSHNVAFCEASCLHTMMDGLAGRSERHV